MRIGPDASHHLSRCGQRRASGGWEDLLGSLQESVPLKRRLAGDRAFAVGLRLCARDAADLQAGDRLDQLRQHLETRGLYLHTIDGTAYGGFAPPRVKDQVFAPDWTSEQRLAFTVQLSGILGALLPEGVEGSVTTIPLSYQAWSQRWRREGFDCAVMRLLALVEALVAMERAWGRTVHVDLAPEPGGTLSDTGDVLRFFESWLLPRGGPELARRLGISRPEAEGTLLKHLRIGLDTCHMAVAYEEVEEAIARLEKAGIRIGKLRLGHALSIRLPVAREQQRDVVAALRPCAESPTLLQVKARLKGGFYRAYPDLPQALLDLKNDRALEWRLHHHAPLFAKGEAPVAVTVSETQRILARWLKQPFCRHLEIATDYRGDLTDTAENSLVHALTRDYRWTLDVLAASPAIPEATPPLPRP